MRRLALLLVFLTSISGVSLASAQARYGQTLCQDPNFMCLKVQKGESWQSLFADPQLRDVVMRLNRVNIPLQPGMVIAIPNELSGVTVMDIAPFSKQIPATGKKLIVVDPAKYAWGAYDENGQLVKWGPAAGGKDYCPDTGSDCRTKTGEFTVYLEGTKHCKSSKFPLPDGGAPMPYCMFFHGGYAIHASSDVPGYHASHGCVRVYLEDARWLNQEFVQPGTKVIVHEYPA
jgi:hypothetical protein